MTYQCSDIIMIDNRLQRDTEYRKNNGKHSRRWKVWTEKKLPQKIPVMFLRWRTLSNGYTDYESECGFIYEPIETVKAALVIDIQGNRNPFYALISEGIAREMK